MPLMPIQASTPFRSVLMPNMSSSHGPPMQNASPVENSPPAKLDSAVEVSRGASYLTIQLLITSAAQVLTFAILARIITPREIGILAVLSLVVALCAAINGAAFQQATTKFIGELGEGGRKAGLGVFYQAFRITIILSAPLAVVIFLGAPTLASDLLGDVAQTQLFRILAIDTLFYSGALPVALGALLGFKKFKAAATIGSAGSILRQCLIILLILALTNFIGLVIAWTISDIALVAAYTGYLVWEFGRSKVGFPARRMLNYSWPLSVGNIVNFSYNYFDRAILIVFVPLAALGVYNAALTAFGVILSVQGAMGNALLPALSDIGGRGELASCRRASWFISRYASLSMVPLGFGLLATAQPAITLFVGHAYIGGVEPLMILCGVFALVAFGIGLGPMLLALSHTRAIMLITAASVLVGLVSAFFLLPVAGIVGASIARGLALAGSTILTVVVLKRRKALRLDFEAAWKSLVAGGAMVAVLLLAQAVAYNRLLLPVYVVLGAIVYLVALRLLKAIREDDVRLFRRYLGPRFGFAATVLNALLLPK